MMSRLTGWSDFRGGNEVLALQNGKLNVENHQRGRFEQLNLWTDSFGGCWLYHEKLSRGWGHKKSEHFLEIESRGHMSWVKMEQR